MGNRAVDEQCGMAPPAVGGDRPGVGPPRGADASAGDGFLSHYRHDSNLHGVGRRRLRRLDGGASDRPGRVPAGRIMTTTPLLVSLPVVANRGPLCEPVTVGMPFPAGLVRDECDIHLS